MTSQNFRSNPMFLRNQFESEGVFEIPKIQKDEISLENVELIGYDKISENEKEKNKSKIVHFFLDDYKFNVIWNDPEPYGPHWDYIHPDGWKRGYRIFPDGTYEMKIFEGDVCFA